MTIDEELAIGRMPQPRYFGHLPKTPDGTSWIGIKGYSLDKEVKNFLWWQNFQGDLSKQEDRRDIATLVVRIKCNLGIDAAVGLPLDLNHGSIKKEEITILYHPYVYGVYIEAARRPMFTFRADIPDENETREKLQRAGRPSAFDKLLQKALEVLPYMPNK